MALSHFGKLAIAAAGLTLASLGATAPASAQWGGPRVETVQYYGGGGYGYGRPGWRRDYRPRCFTERIVRRNPWGRRVVEVRRVCR